MNPANWPLRAASQRAYDHFWVFLRRGDSIDFGDRIWNPMLPDGADGSWHCSCGDWHSAFDVPESIESGSNPFRLDFDPRPLPSNAMIVELPKTKLPDISWRKPRNDEIYHTPDGTVWRGRVRIVPRGTSKGLRLHRRVWLWLRYGAW